VPETYITKKKQIWGHGEKCKLRNYLSKKKIFETFKKYFKKMH